MAKQVNANGSGSTKYQNRTVDGIDMWAICTHTTPNTAFAGSSGGNSAPVFNTNEANIQIELTQNGKKDVVYGGVLRPALVTTHGTANQLYWKGDNFLVLTKAAAGVNEVVMVPLRIQFPTPVTLKGDDFLQVNCQVRKAFSAESNINLSNFYFEPSDAIGYQMGTPKIEIIHLAENSNDTHTLGSGIVAVHLVDFSPTYGSQSDELEEVFTSYSLQSDKLDRMGDFWELVATRSKDIESSTVAVQHSNSYEIFKDTVPLNRTALTVSVNPTYKGTGRQYVVTCRVQKNAAIAKRTDSVAAKHAVQNAKDLGLV